MSLSSHNEDFFLKVREPEAQAMERWGGRGLWRTCFVTVSQRRVAMKVAGLSVCVSALLKHKQTDEQVPLSLSTLASALPLE